MTVIAETLADQTLTAFGAARGAVVLRSQDGTSLETVAWRGHATAVIDRWRRFPLDARSPIGDAVHQERTRRHGGSRGLARPVPRPRARPGPGGRGLDPARRRRTRDRWTHAQLRSSRASSRPTTSASCSAPLARAPRRSNAPARKRSGGSRRSGWRCWRGRAASSRSRSTTRGPWPRSWTSPCLGSPTGRRWRSWSRADRSTPSRSRTSTRRRSRSRRSSAASGRPTSRRRPASGT